MGSFSLEMPVVNGDAEGETLVMECHTGTTFLNVSTFLEKQLGDHTFKVFLGERGIRFLDDLLPFTLAGYLCFTGSLPVSVKPRNIPDINVRVKCLTGWSHIFRMNRKDTVEGLKRELLFEKGIPIDQQRLVLKGTHLKNAKTLETTGIDDGSKVHLILNMRGGGRRPFAFVDATNNEAIRDVSWTDSGPEWYSVNHGLVIHGICQNPSCVAYQEKVLSNHGMGVWNANKLSARCPMCKYRIEPTNLGFNNCFYKVRGVKKGYTSESSTTWTKIGDWYRTWEKAKSGVANWNKLEISTKTLSRSTRLANGDCVPVASECAICFDIVEPAEPVEMLRCYHSYHTYCWSRWYEAVRGKGNAVTCPLCRTVIKG